MTLDEVKSLVNLKYPTSLVHDPEDWDKAVARALKLINRLSGGKSQASYPNQSGPQVLRIWSLYDPADPNTLTAVVDHNYKLDSIHEDNNFIYDNFTKLVEAYINEIVADRLFLSDSLEDLPFDLKMETVYAETQRKEEEVKQDFADNYLVPWI